MTLYVGNDDAVTQKVKKAYIGVDGIGRNIKAMYVGDDDGIARKVFPDGGGSTDVDPEGLTFTSDNPFTLKFAGNGGYSTPANIEMTTNGNDWTSFNSASVITFDSAMNTATGKHTIAVRSDDYINDDTSSYEYYIFSSTNGTNISVSKNLTYITGGKNEENRDYAFDHLFEGFTELVDASQLIIPYPSSIGRYAYYYMFRNCTKLKKAPNLPNTVIDYIGENCMYSMFQNCDLEGDIHFATPKVCDHHSCADMFAGCKNLNPIIDFSNTTVFGGGACSMMLAETKTKSDLNLNSSVEVRSSSFGDTYLNCKEFIITSVTSNAIQNLVNRYINGDNPFNANTNSFMECFKGCTKNKFVSSTTSVKFDFSDSEDLFDLFIDDDPFMQMFEGISGAPEFRGDPGSPELGEIYYLTTV